MGKNEGGGIEEKNADYLSIATPRNAGQGFLLSEEVV